MVIVMISIGGTYDFNDMTSATSPFSCVIDDVSVEIVQV